LSKKERRIKNQIRNSTKEKREGDKTEIMKVEINKILNL